MWRRSTKRLGQRRHPLLKVFTTNIIISMRKAENYTNNQLGCNESYQSCSCRIMTMDQRALTDIIFIRVYIGHFSFSRKVNFSRSYSEQITRNQGYYLLWSGFDVVGRLSSATFTFFFLLFLLLFFPHFWLLLLLTLFWRGHPTVKRLGSYLPDRRNRRCIPI
jgi:hypothetical protein